MKQWIRKWLEIDKDADFLRVSDTLIRQRLDLIELTQNEHREQIRTLMIARVKEVASQRAVPRYSDFETSQVEALNEFKEN